MPNGRTRCAQDDSCAAVFARRAAEGTQAPCSPHMAQGFGGGGPIRFAQAYHGAIPQFSSMTLCRPPIAPRTLSASRFLTRLAAPR
ncbi:hypothetical protein RO07_00445 [Pandoraea pulmonicola]|uniref:Uncharacterized protein n=1 Tax=Pandoraea pulmonicola TaxID=93221 RepID=A0AAJ4ZG52_PANPU|nr:hypothetical protein RO07_00445 [Pandoraea pulmonicola]SUA92670.1 Uncharacterised protein [Pandoraea pulmonicola]